MKKNKYFLWFAFYISMCILIWCIGAILILLPERLCLFHIPLDIQARGDLGDAFNIVNSFFSALALIFLILAVYYQHLQLSQVSKESKEQKQYIDRQMFENTFFRLISIHNEVINSLEENTDRGNLKGRSCFLYFFEQFSSRYEPTPEPHELNIEIKAIEQAFNKFDRRYRHQMENYFSRVLNIFRYVDASFNVPSGEKHTYVEIVHSHMSKYEIKFLFYHSLTPEGAYFKEFNKKYRLWSGLKVEELLDHFHYQIIQDSL